MNRMSIGGLASPAQKVYVGNSTKAYAEQSQALRSLEMLIARLDIGRYLPEDQYPPDLDDDEQDIVDYKRRQQVAEASVVVNVGYGTKVMTGLGGASQSAAVIGNMSRQLTTAHPYTDAVREQINQQLNRQHQARLAGQDVTNKFVEG